MKKGRQAKADCKTNMLFTSPFEMQHFWQERNKCVFTLFEPACVLQATTDPSFKNLLMYHYLWEVWRWDYQSKGSHAENTLSFFYIIALAQMRVIHPWRPWESVLSWVSAKNIACCPPCIKLQFRHINPSHNLSPNKILSRVSVSFGALPYLWQYSYLSWLVPSSLVETAICFIWMEM